LTARKRRKSKEDAGQYLGERDEEWRDVLLRGTLDGLIDIACEKIE